MMKKILLIDTSDIGAAYSAEAVIALGFEPVFLINLNEFHADTKNQIKRYSHFHVDTKSTDALLAVITEHRITHIEGIMTTLDSKMAISVKLASLLGIRSMHSSLLNLCNKGLVAKLIPEYSPNSFEFSIDTITSDKIDFFIKDFKKVLIKPAKAAGGYAVKTFSGNINSKDIILHCQQYFHTEWVLSKFIEGNLVSLEGFVHDDKITFLGFTGRTKIGNTETTSLFPVDHSIPEKIKFRTKAAIEKLIDRSHYQNGYFHTEFMISDSNCYLIDANFGRIGGGTIAELIAFSFDINPITIFKHIIQLTLFSEMKFENPFSKASARYEAMGIQYGVPVSIKLHSVITELNHHTKHTQLLEPDQIIPAVGDDNWSWLGLLTGGKEDVLNDIEKIIVKSENETFTPCY